ncbi:MAG: hypothetical protein L6275_00935 [Candidatus Portnoybacteria bacterium]|nr:hypothetical protein [Candidatus Portnoybacteria bacterium]
MEVDKVTRVLGGGVVVEFYEGSIYFSEDFLSETKMNSEKYQDWSDVSQEFFGEMSEDDIKNVARQINKRICTVGSLCRGVVYNYVNILPRKGNGTPAKELVKISDACLVEKGGREHLQGFVNGKKYSVAAKTRFMAAEMSL